MTGEGARSGGFGAALPAAAAGRLTWEPSPIRVRGSFQAATTKALRFSTALAGGLQEWHDRMSGQGVSLAATRPTVVAPQRVEREPVAQTESPSIFEHPAIDPPATPAPPRRERSPGEHSVAGVARSNPPSHRPPQSWGSPRERPATEFATGMQNRPAPPDAGPRPIPIAPEPASDHRAARLPARNRPSSPADFARQISPPQPDRSGIAQRPSPPMPPAAGPRPDRSGIAQRPSPPMPPAAGPRPDRSGIAQRPSPPMPPAAPDNVESADIPPRPPGIVRFERTIGAFLQPDDTPRQGLSIVKRLPVAVLRAIDAASTVPEPRGADSDDRVEGFGAEDRTPPSGGAEPSPQTLSAIERLIERTVQPVPLPDLRFRLVPRPVGDAGERPPALSAMDADRGEAPAPVPPRLSEARDSRQDGATHRAEPQRADKPYRKPAAPPQVDVGAVADKVFRMLQRRQRFERERTGRF